MPLDIGEIKELTEVIFKAHLMRCADGGEEFDIYQNCGFVVVEGGAEYFFSCSRAVICTIVQLISLVFLTYEAMEDSEKGWCNISVWSSGEAFSMQRIAVFFYAAFLGSNFRTFMYSVNWKGCYPMLFYRKKVGWMNAAWIAYGYFMNVFVIMCTAVCTIAVMYSADDIIDIVLNSFALFFIHELDDYMMSLGDYGSIKWEYLGAYWMPEYRDQFQGDHDEEYQLKFELVDCDYYWVVRIVNLIVKFTNVVILIAPFFLFVCY
mmetsp:Transcript_11669/g.17650  ORF Transcript_11669/g.17650 Transcript_11669/m.17650 type:complete len:263 (+) Transcript_11669:51-839(+)